MDAGDLEKVVEEGVGQVLHDQLQVVSLVVHTTEDDLVQQANAEIYRNRTARIRKT